MGVRETAARQADFTSGFIGVAGEVFQFMAEKPGLHHEQCRREQQYRPATTIMAAGRGVSGRVCEAIH
ncbi:hypothetical protein SAMN03097708_01325 [Thiohalomonas denitrificans]|uniref:Uncharacterized protein n=1 Tax=Thiohalomonas denitrificans TaxID=415747 RepID=A0A1G5Q318_9GAMM|nr:hypothetical protein SAMN03097708_01325 [Thiohalomonas denitrificans]